MQVGAFNARVKTFDLSLFQAKLSDNVLLDIRCGRGSQCQGGGMTQGLADLGQPCIVRPKVMSPFADTMRFVHGQQVNGSPGQHLKKVRLAKALGCHVQQVVLSLSHLGITVESLAAVQRGIDECGMDTARTEHIHLVLHQGDQGGYHQGQTMPLRISLGQGQGRDLVAQ